MLRGRKWHIIHGLMLLMLLSTACDETDPAYNNPGFVEVESVQGQTAQDYYSNFEEPEVDIYQEPTYLESERIVKIKAKGNREEGSIVVNEGAGVGYLYEKGKKREVVVTADESGQLWAVDKEGQTYEVAIAQ